MAEEEFKVTQKVCLKTSNQNSSVLCGSYGNRHMAYAGVYLNMYDYVVGRRPTSFGKLSRSQSSASYYQNMPRKYLTPKTKRYFCQKITAPGVMSITPDHFSS